VEAFSGNWLRVQKVPDLHSWKKIGDMHTALGKEFILYESPDGTKLAQVDGDMLIHLIIEDGKPVYMNPKVVDTLKRVAEIKHYLRNKAKRPSL
jgi:sucrose-6-phosphate hydrolase SacC (GH32 family)